MSCPSCGSVLPDGARFCPACGHGVTGRGDERRLVTVVFADLAGFTGLSETLDPEHVKNLVDRCFARLASDITDHGGRVDKVIGDAIVALFGAPVAHEDDAERAIRTGLQMQRTIRTLSGELSVPLHLRVGINSGEVLVGALRAGGDYTAMGDVVNVASRLQTMAAPGTVVVGEATYTATADLFRFDDLGELQARGRDAPVSAWRALDSLAPPGQRPRRAVAPLFGREDEMVVLRQTVGLAVRHRRPLVSILLGEAGIGKSRLIDEVGAWAATEHGALILEGRCVPYGEVNPWWPIAEVVRRACGIEPGDAAEETAAKVASSVEEICGHGTGLPDPAEIAAGLLHLMGDEHALPDVDPQRGRQEARRSLHAFVAGLARRLPVVLVLSDLHWADDLVLELLGVHLERLAGLPVIVMATARSELGDRWVAPHGPHNVLTLHLDPLDAVSTRQLAAALAEGCLVDRDLDALVQRSGGNPFFLEELVSFLVDSGQVDGGALPGGDLPVTLRGLVAARLDVLPPEQRSVLEDAAVIGRSGSVVDLRALSESRGMAGVDDILARLFERDLLGSTGEQWEFRSDLVREVVYDILTKSERARRHWSVASWLSEAARRNGREDEILEFLAHHFATAAELVRDVGPVHPVPADVGERAVTVIERAASWASRRELPATSARLLDRGVDLAAVGSDARCRLLLDRALERATLRDLEGARRDLSEVFAGSEGVTRARALTVLGFVQQLEGDLTSSSETLAKALAAWREAGDRAGEGDTLRRYGMTCLQSGDLPGAETAFTEALGIARELASRRDEAWALWHLAELSFYSGRTEEAEGRLRLAGQAFHEAGDSGGIGWVKGLLGYLKFGQGLRPEAESIAVAILDDARDRGDRWALGMILILLASVRLWQGQASTAIGPATEAVDTFRAINDVHGELNAAGIVVRALAASGQAGRGREVLDDLVSRGHSKADSTLGLAGLASHLGDWRSALDLSETAAIGLGSYELLIIRSMALLQAARVEEAISLAEEVMGIHAEDAKADNDGARVNGWATLALIRACGGDAEGAAAVAGQVVAACPVATYRDLAMAHLALASAGRRLGSSDRGEAAIRAARDEVGRTDDVVTAAVVGLVASRLGFDALPVAEHGLRGSDPAAWQERLRELGADADGWDTVARLAAGG